MIQIETARTTEGLFAEHYGALRRIAQKLMLSEGLQQTLTATALVNEGFLRVAPSSGQGISWESRRHFFKVVATTMRRILIDRARSKNAQKRSSNRIDIPVESLQSRLEGDLDWLLDIDEGLSKLECQDNKAAALVELHLFAGLSIQEAGHTVGLTRHGAYQAWEFAKAWFAARHALLI
jgi:RNA polymerase sigma factor (TIGR02999 family)